jgi:hypothetical protein
MIIVHITSEEGTKHRFVSAETIDEAAHWQSALSLVRRSLVLEDIDTAIRESSSRVHPEDLDGDMLGASPECEGVVQSDTQSRPRLEVDDLRDSILSHAHSSMPSKTDQVRVSYYAREVL